MMLYQALLRAAQESASGPNNRPEPTHAQAKAGNYKKGRFQLHGLSIAIENPQGTVRRGFSKDGKEWANRVAANYGYIAGTRGADGDGIDVFIGPFPESRSVWVINQRNKGGGFDEHKVMLGFVNEAQARAAYLNSYDRGWTGLESMVPASIDQLRWWIKHGNKKVAMSPDQLPHEGTPVMDQVLWNAEAMPRDRTLAQLIYGMRTEDAGQGLLLDGVTMDELMTDPDIEERLAMDALVVEVGRLQPKMQQLLAVMKAAGDTVKPVDFTISDPVKMRGTLQIAVLFAMTDGQTVTVWLHNPDTTPNRLTPMDELVSWKWMLNKRDITIVVAPERGRDLNIREVARRIMRLVERNSAAFANANARATERAGQLQALDTEIADLTNELNGWLAKIDVAREAKDNELAATDGKIRDLQSRLDMLTEASERAKQKPEVGDLYGTGLSLQAILNEIDDTADEIRTLRGEPVQGRTSWDQWQALRDAEAQRAVPEPVDPTGGGEATTQDEESSNGDETAVQPEGGGDAGDVVTTLADVPSTILAELDGTEVLSREREQGDDGEPIPLDKRAFDAARQYFREEIQGRSYNHQTLGPIQVGGRVTWGKIKHGLTYNLLRVKLLPAIPALLRKGFHVGQKDLDKDRRDGATAFHHLVGWVNVGGLRVEAGVSVAEFERGKIMYNLTDSPSALLAKKQSRIVESGNGPTDSALDSTAEAAEDETSMPNDDALVNLDDASGASVGMEVLNLYVLKVVGADGQEIEDIDGEQEPVPAVDNRTTAERLAQDLADVLLADGFGAYLEASSKVVGDRGLSVHEHLDLGRLVERLVGPERMTLERAKHHPETQGRKAWHRGESPIPPEGLSDEQRAQWLAGWDAAKQYADEAKPDTVTATAADLEKVLIDLGFEAKGVFYWVKRIDGAPGLFGASYSGGWLALTARGEPLADFAVDGKLTVAELEQKVRDAMQGYVAPDEDVDPASPFVPFDPAAIKMPTAVQMGFNIRGKIRVWESEPGQVAPGWTNGIILDVASRPKVVEAGIAKYSVDLNGLNRIDADRVERVVSGVRSHSIEVFPVALDTSETVTYSTKGETRTPSDAVILADEGQTEMAAINRYALGYFSKTYRGAQFFIDQAPGAFVLVKHHGAVVGVIAPVNYKDKRATLGNVRRALTRAQIEATNPIKMVDDAYRFETATDRFKEYIAETVAETSYSMFATAKEIDEAVKGQGGEVSWDIEQAALDSATLDGVEYAVSSLKNALEIVRNNEPINRAEGNEEQADLEAEVAQDIEEALAVLQDHQSLFDDADDCKVALDAVASSAVVGRISKGGQILGRAVILGDGKAMIFTGESGVERVQVDMETEVKPAWWTQEGAFLVKYLFNPPAVVPVPDAEAPTALAEPEVVD